MTNDHDDDAVMEKIRSEPKLALSQHLRGIAFPSIRFAIESYQATDQEHGEAEIRIDAEEKTVHVVGGQHRHSPLIEALAYCEGKGSSPKRRQWWPR